MLTRCQRPRLDPPEKEKCSQKNLTARGGCFWKRDSGGAMSKEDMLCMNNGRQKLGGYQAVL